jgi:hypothetical protein
MTATPEILDSVESESQTTTAVGAPAPVLITVQQVALGTAVALQARPSALRRTVTAMSAALAEMRSLLSTSASEVRTPRRDYPKRYAFLEDSCMARAMDRL